MSLYVLKTSTSTSWWRNDMQEGDLFILAEHELITELQSDTFRTTDRNSHDVCGSCHVFSSVFYVCRSCFHLCSLCFLCFLC